jgi:membrane-bound lytic murein transglycosylase B
MLLTRYLPIFAPRRLAFFVLCSLSCAANSANSTATNAPTYTERAEVQAFISEMASAHDFDEALLQTHFAAVRPVPKAIAFIKPPANPSVRSWRTYRSRFIEPKRIAAGERFMRRYASDLARAQARYGVPASVIAGVIGVETIYGRNVGDFNTFATLTTLAFDYPPRADLFRKELRELLLLARSESRAPQSYVGSYAGALGLPQFLPSSIRAYGVDFDQDGHVDLAGSAQDAIGSVANYLAAHGWERDEPIAAMVVATGEGINQGIADGISPVRTQASWGSAGVEFHQVSAGETAIDAASLSALRPDKPAALIDLVTPDAPTQYRLGYQNFYVITRYNKSTFYASAVMDLALALEERRDEDE